MHSILTRGESLYKMQVCNCILAFVEINLKYNLKQVDTQYIQKDQNPLKCTMYIISYRNLSMPPFPKAKVCKHYISEHSLLGSGSGKQNIRHSQKIYIFWKLFIYRIIITIHNGASWVLPIGDFFKLFYSKKGKFSLFFSISKLTEK